MLRTISNGMVQGLSNFGLDNSMIQKLYSVDREIDSYEYYIRNTLKETGQ